MTKIFPFFIFDPCLDPAFNRACISACTALENSISPFSCVSFLKTFVAVSLFFFFYQFFVNEFAYDLFGNDLFLMIIRADSSFYIPASAVFIRA